MEVFRRKIGEFECSAFESYQLVFNIVSREEGYNNWFGLCVEEFTRSIAKCLRYRIMQDVCHVCLHIPNAYLIENILDGKVRTA